MHSKPRGYQYEHEWMGEIMDKEHEEGFYINIIEKIHRDLKYIDSLSSVSDMKEKINEMIRFIDDETLNNKGIFEEIIGLKLKETANKNPELNTHLYILYRNLNQNKISIQEAKKIYKIYLKEYQDKSII